VAKSYERRRSCGRRRVQVIVRIVRFKSGLSDEEVQATYEERAVRFREIPGLVQKYYLRFPETGEYGAVYVWESHRSMEEFSNSELARSIPEAYRVEGMLDAEVADVRLVLRPTPERLERVQG
jgi:heme-degrading monooxygenase HmoA